MLPKESATRISEVGKHHDSFPLTIPTINIMQAVIIASTENVYPLVHMTTTENAPAIPNIQVVTFKYVGTSTLEEAL